MSLLSSIEGFGETLLEDLIPIFAGLSAAKNPDLAPDINAAGTALVAEVQSIQAGNLPTASSPATAALASAVVNGAATKALSNTGNPTTKAIIGTVQSVIDTAISPSSGS